MKVGSVVRHARRRKGLTQRGLAARSGVPQSTVGRIESGAVVPRVDTLDRLLEACDESIEALPRIGIGIDRTLIHEMLKLSPRERLTRASSEANNLNELLATARRR